MSRPGGIRGLVLVVAATVCMAPGVGGASLHETVGCGETVVRSLDQPVAFDFSALEGEVVSITVAGTGGVAGSRGGLRWVLTDSGGRPVSTSGGEVCSGECEARLPANDTFTVSVLDTVLDQEQRAELGTCRDFSVSLEAVSATADGRPNGPPTPTCARLGADGQPDGTRVIERGEPAAGTLDVAGETDTFTFLAEKAETLRIDVSAAAGAAGESDPRFHPQWQLFDPQGHRVLTAGGRVACAGSCETEPLASRGTFTIEVGDAGLDAAGGYVILLGEGSSTSTVATTTLLTITLPTITLPTTTLPTITLPTITLPTITLPTITSTTTTLPGSTAPPPYELSAILRPPRDTVFPEQMGAAVAASGDTVLIGAPHDGTVARDAGLVYVVGVAGGAASPGFGRLLGTLRKPGTPSPGDGFGAAVAAVGNGVLVGAPGDDRAAPGGGAAYLFPDSAGGAPIVLLPPARVAGEQFGFSLATLGDDLLVGAPGSGRVYLFRATGELVRTFQDPRAAPDERFGAAIGALGARIVVIGAPGAAGTAGKVMLFDAVTGASLLTLKNPLGRPDDGFGSSVVAAGVVADGVVAAGLNLLVGAPGVGEVFLFEGGITGALLRSFQPPTPGAGDRFGASIAVAGSRVLIGAPSDSGQATDGGATYLFDLATGTLQSVFRRPEPQAEDLFGTAVAAVGSRVLIGAPGDDAGLIDGGAAYLFSGATLEAVFRKRLSAAAFGASVAAAGADVLVGAPRGGTGAGSVSRFDAGSGAAGATVDSPVAGDPRFGFSVAALGGDLVAGAPFQDGPAGAAIGAAYVFAGTALRATLANPYPVGGDQLGFSVATLGSDVLVGAPLAGTQDTGVAHLFDGGSGALKRTFRKPTPTTGDFFGAALAGEGDEVLIGAPLDGTAAANVGAAYLFRRDTVVLVRTFESPTAAAGDLFGAAVALTPRLAIIGAPLADVGAPEAGVVHLFDRATGSLLRRIENPTPGRGDHFGHALATIGDNLLVGAELDDTDGLDAGAAYLFDASTGALLETFLDPAGGAFDHFGSALAPTGSGLMIGAPGSSHVYLFRPTGQAASVASPSLVGPRAVPEATGTGARCGNGIVEPGEECDTGNSVDQNDCRSNCTRPICCTLDPLVAQRCDDGNPCTDDSLDPTTGCISVPNGRCCTSDASCASGKCRVCDGCFLYPWDCCDQGSTCVASAAECVGFKCLAAAYCSCTGGLTCADGAVPTLPESLFTGACDQLRLEESLGPTATPAGRLAFRAARSHVRKASRLMRKAGKTTRKMMRRGALSRQCGKAILGRIRTVKRAIPRGRRLRQCVLSR